jgi:glucosamine--fructose-6-phosphate aminotransferase (isomerizing)
VHLIEKFYKNIPLEKAVCFALKMLVGSFAIGVISSREPAKLVGARSGSPLILGLGKNENFIASDAPAVLDSTKDIIFLDENEVAILTKNNFRVTDLNGKPILKKAVRINWDIAKVQKSGFEHFMLKEINEQPQILENLMHSRVDQKTNRITFEEQDIPESKLKNIKNIFIVACGTAYHAGLAGKYILESVCAIPAQIDVSSEFRYRDLLIGPDTLVIAISQSGETADTLAGVREAKKLKRNCYLQCFRFDPNPRIRRYRLYACRPRNRGRFYQGLYRSTARSLFICFLPCQNKEYSSAG